MKRIYIKPMTESYNIFGESVCGIAASIKNQDKTPHDNVGGNATGPETGEGGYIWLDSKKREWSDDEEW